MTEEWMRFDTNVAARVARFFDSDYVDYREDLPTLRALARRTGGPLLELGCGTGRLAIPLAEAGYEITGVDFSSEMLDIARKRANSGKAASRLRLIEGDFATVPLGGPYKLAFIVMNTFLHLLTQEEQVRALRHWHAHLASGGYLLIDVFAPDVDELANVSGLVEYEKSWPDPDTGTMVMKQVIRTVDPAEQMLHVTFAYDVISPGGQVQRTLVPFDLRYIWRFEAELLLEKAGFQLEELYGSWDLGPFDSGSERMILIAKKQD